MTTTRCDIPDNPSPRVPVREIPCSTCGRLFSQTAHEFKRKITTGPQCAKLLRAARRKPKKTGDRNFLEVVLPRTLTPHYDKAKNQWYMKVRVRKRNTDEPLQHDRVLLGLGKDAEMDQVNAAFTAAYSRLEMNGSSCNPIETIRKKRKRIASIRRDIASWRQGRDRDLGVFRAVIRKVVYKVYLPDPKVDKKKHYFGRYDTRAEARKARDKAYRELKDQHVPCGVCGKMPVNKKGRLTHFSAECPNKVQIPTGIRPLFQAKLWNLVFSSGKVPDAGKLTQEDLHHMGFMKCPKGKRFYARSECEFDLSLAKKYAKERHEEDVFFE